MRSRPTECRDRRQGRTCLPATGWQRRSQTVFLVLRPANEPVDASVEKFVLGVWPIFDGERYLTSICNLSVTVGVASSSPCPLSQLVLLAEPRYFAGRPVQIMDIAYTLLEAENPITHTTKGTYRHAAGSRVLQRYDGLADVEVVDDACFKAHVEPSAAYRRLDVLLKESIRPGRRAAVRFCFVAGGVFAAAPDGELRFYLTMQSDFPICQMAPAAVYVPRTLALLSVASDGVAGGLDVFLYMPLGLEGDGFTIDPVARLLPDYDHLGRRMAQPRLKHCWSGQILHRSPGSLIEIGQRITIDGRFKRRHMSTVNNHFNHVNGNVFTAPVNGNVVNNRANLDVRQAHQSGEALHALEQLRGVISLHSTTQDAEIAQAHAGAIEAAIRDGRLSQAHGRLAALARACGDGAQIAAPVLEAIDHLARLI